MTVTDTEYPIFLNTILNSTPWHWKQLCNPEVWIISHAFSNWYWRGSVRGRGFNYLTSKRRSHCSGGGGLDRQGGVSDKNAFTINTSKPLGFVYSLISLDFHRDKTFTIIYDYDNGSLEVWTQNHSQKHYQLGQRWTLKLGNYVILDGVSRSSVLKPNALAWTLAYDDALWARHAFVQRIEPKSVCVEGYWSAPLEQVSGPYPAVKLVVMSARITPPSLKRSV